MKILSLPAWLVLGSFLCGARLAAQDVIVTDPAWLDPEAPEADVLPTFKKRPMVVYSEELKQTGQIHYAIVMQVLNDQGERTSQRLNVSSPLVEKALAGGGAKFNPAMDAGRKVAAGNSYSVIFNPVMAGGDVDSGPRLERVSLVVVDKAQLPNNLRPPQTLWCMVSLDEKGSAQNVVFENAQGEGLRESVVTALKNWRFSPARKSGQAVAAAVRVPFVVSTAFVPKLPIVRPIVLHKEKPLYSRSMKAQGVSGKVLLEFDVDTDGSVKNVVISRDSTPGFEHEAIASMTRWKFSPATVNGKPVKFRMKQLLLFECTALTPAHVH